MIIAIIIGVAIEAVLLAIGIPAYIYVLKLRKELRGLISNSPGINAIGSKDIGQKHFPLPLNRYLKKVLPEDTLKYRIVFLRQAGTIKVQGKYRSFNAEQYYSLKRPGFIWIASVRFFKVFWVNVRDRYIENKAQILVKLLSAFRLEKRSAEELDISALVRYFLEIVWFPFLFADESKVSWEELDTFKAKATIKDGKLSGTAVFEFGEDCLISIIKTEDRFMTKNGGYIKRPYRAELSDYKRLDSCLVPTKVRLYWDNGSEDRKASEIQVTQIRYI